MQIHTHEQKTLHKRLFGKKFMRDIKVSTELRSTVNNSLDNRNGSKTHSLQKKTKQKQSKLMAHMHIHVEL